MATALADAQQLLSTAEAIWTLFGLSLLGAFLAFVSVQGAGI